MWKFVELSQDLIINLNIRQLTLMFFAIYMLDLDKIQLQLDLSHLKIHNLKAFIVEEFDLFENVL